MERIFEENRHFYTNDYNNDSDEGGTIFVDSDSIITEDSLSYIVKKYNIALRYQATNA